MVSFFTSGSMSSTFILTPTPHISDTGSHRQHRLYHSDTDGSDDDIFPTAPRILCNRDDHSSYSARDKIQDRKSRKAASQRRYYQKYGLYHLSNIFADICRLGTRPDSKKMLEFEQLQCKRHHTRPSLSSLTATLIQAQTLHNVQGHICVLPWPGRVSARHYHPAAHYQSSFDYFLLRCCLTTSSSPVVHQSPTTRRTC